MAVIRANLTDSGEIGYMLYGSVEHYVVVLQDDGVNVLIEESNYIKGKITQRLLPKSAFAGFFSL